MCSWNSEPQSFWHKGQVPWKTIFPWIRGYCFGFDPSPTSHLQLCSLEVGNPCFKRFYLGYKEGEWLFYLPAVKDMESHCPTCLTRISHPEYIWVIFYPLLVWRFSKELVYSTDLGLCCSCWSTSMENCSVHWYEKKNILETRKLDTRADNARNDCMYTRKDNNLLPFNSCKNSRKISRLFNKILMEFWVEMCAFSPIFFT